MIDKRILMVLAFALVLAMPDMAFAVTNVAACGVLGTANTVYNLTGNVNSTGTCFNITASNVTLIGNNYLINYSQTGTGHGIYSNSSYTSVSGCTILEGSAQASSYGINLADTLYANLSYNRINTSGSLAFGIVFDISNSSIANYNNITTSGSSAYGMYFYLNSNITAFSNKISITGSDGGWDFAGIVLQNSYSNNITSNVITTAQSGAEGINLVVSSYYNIIKSNTITISGNGGEECIYIKSGQYNNVSYNVINVDGQNSDGIRIDDSYNSIFFNNVSGTASMSNGIYIKGSFNNITGNRISTTSNQEYGMEFEGGNNNTAYSNILIGTHAITSYGLYFFNSGGDNKLYDTNITTGAGTSYDIFVRGTGSVTDYIINSTKFNQADVAFYAGATNNIKVQWYLDVKVNYTTGSPFNQANITALNNTAGQVFSELTGSDGYIARKILTEYMQNNNSKYYQTNYTINATKDGYFNASAQVNLTSSQAVYLTLYASSTKVSFFDEDSYGYISPLNLTIATLNSSAVFYNLENTTQIPNSYIPVGFITFIAKYNGYLRYYYFDITNETLVTGITDKEIFFPSANACSYTVYAKTQAGNFLPDALISVNKIINGSYRTVAQGMTLVDGSFSLYVAYDTYYVLTVNKTGYPLQTFNYIFSYSNCLNPLYFTIYGTEGANVSIPTGDLVNFTITWNPTNPVVNGTVNVTVSDLNNAMTYQYLNITLFNYTTVRQYYFSNTTVSGNKTFSVSVNTTGVFAFKVCLYSGGKEYCASKIYISYVTPAYTGNYTDIGGWNAETSSNLGGLSTTFWQIIVLLSLSVFVGIMFTQVGAFAVVVIPFVMALCTFVWHIFPVSWGIVSILVSLILLKVMM